MAQYWIKGDDGEEYGPASLQEMAEWARENRAGADTPVREDNSNVWQPWQSYPELMTLLAEMNAGTVFPGQPNLHLAPIHRRFFAYVVDILLFSFGGTLVCMFTPGFPIEQMAYSGQQVLLGNVVNPPAILYVVMFSLYLTYFTYFHGAKGQTPGKKLFRIRVVDPTGLTISYWSSFMRALASLFSLNTYCIGFLLIFIIPHRRTFHDLVARTYVVAATA